MSYLHKKRSLKKRLQITKLSKGVHKFLNEQDLYDFMRVDSEGLEETLKKMYAHLPKETVQTMIDSCLPEDDEFEKIDGVTRIPDPEDVPLFSLFGGSTLVVTLPGKIKQYKRYGTFYIPKPLLPSGNGSNDVQQY
jgi:hypothetical protein